MTPVPSLYMTWMPAQVAMDMADKNKAVPFWLGNTGFIQIYLLPDFRLVTKTEAGLIWNTPDKWITQALEFNEIKEESKSWGRQ